MNFKNMSEKILDWSRGDSIPHENLPEEDLSFFHSAVSAVLMDTYIKTMTFRNFVGMEIRSSDKSREFFDDLKSFFVDSGKFRKIISEDSTEVVSMLEFMECSDHPELSVLNWGGMPLAIIPDRTMISSGVRKPFLDNIIDVLSASLLYIESDGISEDIYILTNRIANRIMLKAEIEHNTMSFVKDWLIPALQEDVGPSGNSIKNMLIHRDVLSSMMDRYSDAISKWEGVQEKRRKYMQSVLISNDDTSVVEESNIPEEEDDDDDEDFEGGIIFLME